MAKVLEVKRKGPLAETAVAAKKAVIHGKRKGGRRGARRRR